MAENSDHSGSSRRWLSSLLAIDRIDYSRFTPWMAVGLSLISGATTYAGSKDLVAGFGPLAFFLALIFTLVIQSALVIFTFTYMRMEAGRPLGQRIGVAAGVLLCFGLSVVFSAYGYYDSVGEGSEDEARSSRATQEASRAIDVGQRALSGYRRELIDEIKGRPDFSAWQAQINAVSRAIQNRGDAIADFEQTQQEKAATSTRTRAERVEVLTGEVAILERNRSSDQIKVEQVRGRFQRLSDRLTQIDEDLPLLREKSAGPVAIRASGEAALTPAEARELQDSLKALGFYEGAVDAIIGPQTMEAIRRMNAAVGGFEEFRGAANVGKDVLERTKVLRDIEVQSDDRRLLAEQVDTIRGEIAELDGRLSIVVTQLDQKRAEINRLQGVESTGSNTTSGPTTVSDSLPNLNLQLMAGLRLDTSDQVRTSGTACAQALETMRGITALVQQVAGLTCPVQAFDLKALEVYESRVQTFATSCQNVRTRLETDFPEPDDRFKLGRDCLNLTALQSHPIHGETILEEINKIDASARLSRKDANVHVRFWNAFFTNQTEAQIGASFALIIDLLIIACGAITGMTRAAQQSLETELDDTDGVLALKTLRRRTQPLPPSFPKSDEGFVEMREIRAELTEPQVAAARERLVEMINLGLARMEMFPLVREHRAEMSNADPDLQIYVFSRGARNWLMSAIVSEKGRLTRVQRQRERQEAVELRRRTDVSGQSIGVGVLDDRDAASGSEDLSRSPDDSSVPSQHTGRQNAVEPKIGADQAPPRRRRPTSARR